jgi:hypothetical protein
VQQVKDVVNEVVERAQFCTRLHLARLPVDLDAEVEPPDARLHIQAAGGREAVGVLVEEYVANDRGGELLKPPPGRLVWRFWRLPLVFEAAQVDPL